MAKQEIDVVNVMEVPEAEVLDSKPTRAHVVRVVEDLVEPVITAEDRARMIAAESITREALAAEATETVFVGPNLSLTGYIHVVVNGVDLQLKTMQEHTVPASVAALLRARMAGIA